MKARRVFIQLEIETAASLKDLKKPANWQNERMKVLQVQVNVAKKK